MPSVLVTGAGRGIGKSIVEHLATRGWDVMAGVRKEQDAAAVAQLNPQRDMYARHIAGVKKRIPVSQKLAVPAETVSAVAEEALTARRPRARYVVGVGPRLQVALMTNLPASARDRLLRRVSGQP